MDQEGFNVASWASESGGAWRKTPPPDSPAAADQMGRALLPVIFILLFMTPVRTYRPERAYKRCIQMLTVCVRVCVQVQACISLTMETSFLCPTLKKLMATALGSCHGSKFPIPFIEKIMKHQRDLLCSISLINQFYCFKCETLCSVVKVIGREDPAFEYFEAI